MPSYTLNEKYFDDINSPDKAYWLGFIWGEGYVSRRERNNHIYYEFKLSLSSADISHLELLKKSLCSTHSIKKYNISNGFKTLNYEARLYISNNYFAQTLFNKYGIIPYRTDFSKITSLVPSIFYKYLIRGLLDSDGCITHREIRYKHSNRKEFSMSFTSVPDVLDFINEQLINNNLSSTVYTQRLRHKDRYEPVRSIMITGNIIVLNILNWIYKEYNYISLDRKNRSYKELILYMNKYRREKCNV
jgi:hypothetical protein